MARSRYKWSEAKIWKWVNEGRGQGAGADYLPWVRVSDVPFNGVSHPIWGEQTQREAHFHQEYLLYLWSSLQGGICDIRETFPLRLPDSPR